MNTKNKTTIEKSITQEEADDLCLNHNFTITMPQDMWDQYTKEYSLCKTKQQKMNFANRFRSYREDD